MADRNKLVEKLKDAIPQSEIDDSEEAFDRVLRRVTRVAPANVGEAHKKPKPSQALTSRKPLLGD